MISGAFLSILLASYRQQRKEHHLGLNHHNDGTRVFYFTLEAIHAACEDYRVSAGLDLEHDWESRARGQQLRLETARALQQFFQAV